MSDTPSTTPSLDEILQREANFRARVIRDFTQLERENRLRQEEIDRLNHLVGAKDTYIHQLHLERDARQREQLKALEEKETYIHRLHLERAQWRAEVERARADCEFLVQQAKLAEEQGAKARLRLRGIESSIAFAIAKPLVALERSLSPVSDARPDLLPGLAVRYHLTPSPYRVLSEESLILEGWIESGKGRSLASLRARVGGSTFTATPAESTDLAPEGGALCFRFNLSFPAGRSWLQLEIEDENGTWYSFLNTPVWRRPETAP